MGATPRRRTRQRMGRDMFAGIDSVGRDKGSHPGSGLSKRPPAPAWRPTSPRVLAMSGSGVGLWNGSVVQMAAWSMDSQVLCC